MVKTRATVAQGFTLVELMIAVAIVGVIASIAMPAFSSYAMRAKSSEGQTHLQQIYLGIQSYWNREFAAEQGLGSTGGTQCITRECCGGPNQTIPPLFPTDQRRDGNWDHPEMAQIGFRPAGPVYASYAWAIPDSADVSGQCGLTEDDFSSPLVYVIFAITDLDGDGIYGGYSLQIGIEGESLYREPGFGNTRSANLAIGMDCAPLCSDDPIE